MPGRYTQATWRPAPLRPVSTPSTPEATTCHGNLKSPVRSPSSARVHCFVHRVGMSGNGADGCAPHTCACMPLPATPGRHSFLACSPHRAARAVGAPAASGDATPAGPESGPSWRIQARGICHNVCKRNTQVAESYITQTPPRTRRWLSPRNVVVLDLSP